MRRIPPLLLALLLHACGGRVTDDLLDATTDSRADSTADAKVDTSFDGSTDVIADVPCTPGLTYCTDRCVNVLADPANCGACGRSCCPGTVCTGGKCILGCAAGTYVCGDCTTSCASCRCVDLNTDTANCGRCANACPSGIPCVKGSCYDPCGGGLALCGTTCVDLRIDPSHCGKCDIACLPGYVCSGSACIKP